MKEFKTKLEKELGLKSNFLEQEGDYYAKLQFYTVHGHSLFTVDITDYNDGKGWRIRSWGGLELPKDDWMWGR